MEGLLESWIWVLLAAVVLFLMMSVLKTIVGLVFQYIMFVVLAGILYHIQTNEDASFNDFSEFQYLFNLETLSTLATIAGISFAFTYGMVALLFRNSKLKSLIYPVIGFGATFVATAMVTQVS